MVVVISFRKYIHEVPLQQVFLALLTAKIQVTGFYSRSDFLEILSLPNIHDGTVFRIDFVSVKGFPAKRHMTFCIEVHVGKWSMAQ